MAGKRKHTKTSDVTADDSYEDNKQKPQIYAKDSMDRFGDDLCQLLLSYLTLADRFATECVSKQLRRTVFASVVDITLDDKLISKTQGKESIEDFNNIITLSHISLQTIAKKCANIATIDCTGMVLSDKHSPEVLGIFRYNCRHLQEIYCKLLSYQLFPSFGSLITRIYCMDSPKSQSLIQLHRLSQLHAFELSDAFDITSGQLLAKNLRKFSYIRESIYNSQQLSAFVAHNQSLKSLGLRTHETDTNETRTEMCGQLSRLTQLRELSIYFVLTNGHNSLNACLRTIGLNCKQLRRLSLALHSTDPQLYGNTMDSLRVYSRLKRLDLLILESIDEKLLEPLKLCHRLTHLTLDIQQMSDKLLDNCGNHWPRLQYLTIRSDAITAECLVNISRLPALQTLDIRCRHSIDLLDNDFYDLLSRSPKLKDIKIIEKYVKKCGRADRRGGPRGGQGGASNRKCDDNLNE
ncbi:unnamed protein product [Medioppia subpectinata]|uniref:Uncharacterized protein n=1 Tax=Medioppia subpectinata TaxID=1979941 RepID=A0A7R9L756_9ACAR|nr:unnamed protein product [Medioppia subpectinata]CAG2116587.1 unnamed protein product [Medioppia subpectinata]